MFFCAFRTFRHLHCNEKPHRRIKFNILHTSTTLDSSWKIRTQQLVFLTIQSFSCNEKNCLLLAVWMRVVIVRISIIITSQEQDYWRRTFLPLNCIINRVLNKTILKYVISHSILDIEDGNFLLKLVNYTDIMLFLLL